MVCISCRTSLCCPLMELKNRVVFVTGGAKRIGKAIALAFAERGCHVSISYRSSEAEASATIEQVKNLGVKALAVRGDVSNPEDVRRWKVEIEKELGTVNILINNASIFNRTLWPDIGNEEWDQHLDTNLKGPFLCAQAFGPEMVKAGIGKIINLVDHMGEHPNRPDFIPYAVSKAGLISLTKALAKTLAPQVQVVGIGPGAILWPEEIAESDKKNLLAGIPAGRIGDVNDIAHTVRHVCEGTDYISGGIIYVDGGRAIS